MLSYTTQERVSMVLVVAECLENFFLAERVYAARYPDLKHPDRRVLKRVFQRFKDTGNVTYAKRELERPQNNEDNAFLVLQSVVENPHTSQREICRATGVSRPIVSQVLKQNKFHAYHYQFHQSIYEGDYQRRVDFCMWASRNLQQDPEFVKFILFSDESTFHNNGRVNRHNFHYYDTQNPNKILTLDHQHRWSVNVWGGIIADRVIGPYFFNERLTGQQFLAFLQGDFWDLVDDIPLRTLQRMWFQLDGAPPHFHINVRQYLDNMFPHKWIGRGGPQQWPPRSPDLTSLDFFLWGYIKDLVYRVPPTTREDMKLRITNAFRTVTPHMLAAVRESFTKRINICIQQEGRHFEHLL